MIEEIRINGQLIDTYNDQHIEIEVQSNILRKVDDIKCGYSYTYTIPKTPRNLQIFGFVDMPQIAGAKVRQYLTAQYFRDGFKIFDGTAIISEINTDIEVNFYFGINNSLQAIKDDDTNLNTLYNNVDLDYYGSLSPYAIFANLPVKDKSQLQTYPLTSMPYCMSVPLPNDRQSDGCKFTLKYGQYCVPVYKTIFGQLKNRYGLQITGLQEDDETGVNDPVFQWKASLRKVGSFQFESTNSSRITSGSKPYTNIYFEKGFKNYTSPDIFDLQGEHYDIDSWSESRYPVFKCDIKITKVVVMCIGSYGTGNAGTLQFAQGDLFAEPVDIGDLGTKQSTSTIYKVFDFDELGIDGTLKAGKAMYFRIWDNDYDYYYGLEVFGVVNSDEQDEGYFNLFDTMPEISITDFINDFAFTTYGKFAINTLKNDGYLHFTSLQEIADNTPVNWSEKLLSDGMKLTYQKDGLNQKNWCEVATDDSEFQYQIEHHFDKSFATADTSLDKEGEYQKSNFTPALVHYDGLSWYVTHDSIENADKSPAPRIMTYNSRKSVEIDSTQYVTTIPKSTWVKNGFDVVFKNTLNVPVKLECKCKLDTTDLAGLDFTHPVYFNQFGLIWYIDKVKFGSDNVAELTLYRIKKYDDI